MNIQTPLPSAAPVATRCPPRSRWAGRPGAIRFASVLLLLLGGCATSRVNSELAREVVLNYVGGDVGTVGPYSQQAKQEFEILSPKDRQEASALIDRGAVAFLIFEPRKSTAVRVVLVQKDRVVGDFRPVKAEAKPAPVPAPAVAAPAAAPRR